MRAVCNRIEGVEMATISEITSLRVDFGVRLESCARTSAARSNICGAGSRCCPQRGLCS